MKRYIDVDLLNKKLDSFDTEATRTEYNCGYGDCLTAVQDTISDIPVADVEKVVRCKDCKYFIDQDGMCYGQDIRAEEGYDCYKNENDFCSYGERKILK